MNTETTLFLLEQKLSLKGMANKLRSILEIPTQNRPGVELAMAQLAEAEIIHRKNAKTEKLLKNSKLRFKTPLQEITCSSERNLSNEQLSSLATCDFVKKGSHVIITGKAGCGKTWLSCALGRQACLHGYKVLFYNMTKLSEELATANLTGTYLKYIEKLMKLDVLILDDFGLKKIDEITRLALYNLLDGNREDYKLSLIITSQLPVDNWYDYLTAGSQTESILDRLLSGEEERVTLMGKSLRKSKK